MQYYILSAKEHNVYKNLAFELSLMTALEKRFAETKEPVFALFLWSNDKTIVIGRNQNLYKECNIDFCKINNILIARRISGGGAVFHDLNNLNFTFLSSKNTNSKKDNYTIIKNALGASGIEVVQTGRNDLTVEGRKFSGSAFYSTKNIDLHHGTILINSNHELIQNALTPSELKLKSHCVDSVRSRIINLCEANKLITAEKVEKELISAFKRFYKTENEQTSIEIDKKILENNLNTFQSQDWIYNTKSESNIELSKRFEYGEIQLQLSIRHRKIENCEVYSDSLISDLPKHIKSSLKNASLNKAEFDEQCKNYLKNCDDIELKSALNDTFAMFDKLLI